MRLRPLSISTFAGDQRGVSALEFALLAPIMITFYFGMCEVSQAFMTQKRMGHVAASVADLAAQADSLTNSEVNDIFAAGQTIMRPFSTTTLAQRLTSVTVNSSGSPRVDWSRGSGMTPRGTDTTVTLPAGIAANGESVIMAEVTYNYESPIDVFMPSATQFTRTYYLRPRVVDRVPLT
jgi:Flp pilus assembly protein TadG